ncbi:MAG: hypothetical protein KC413_03535 [Anaerolineales bacterium]|nr:hypothetical protein [Anaerolineales bacterium]
MGKITGLTTQQRDQNRVNVYLDGEYAFSLAVEVAIHLQVGQVLSPDEMAALQA